MLEMNSLCETYQIRLFVRFYENFLELFKSGLLFYGLKATVRKYRPLSDKSWKIDFLHFFVHK